MTSFDVPGWVTALITAVLGLLGGLWIALINRAPGLQAVVDARVRIILEENSRRIADLKQELIETEARAERLQGQVDKLEAEVAHLRDELARQQRMF
jgi:septal ring factor EnvC (AmiA/AmiB activator)